jgi:hypothetical protein
VVIQSFADVAKAIGSYWLALIVLFAGVALLGYGGAAFDCRKTTVNNCL